MNPLKLRRTLILAHLYLASILAPMFILVAITGALYLTGNKGATTSAPITLPASASLDFSSDTIKQDVEAVLESANIEHEFEYVRVRGNSGVTRPTSRPYISFKQTPSGLTASLETPNLQYKMMELHKGHGPQLFKKYQTLAGISLFFVILGGLFVGILAKAYRKQTIAALAGGTIVFIVLAFLI